MTAMQPHYRFTMADYLRMGEVGILHEDTQVELVDGLIVWKHDEEPRDFACISDLHRLVHEQVGDDLLISVRNPVTLSNETSFDPDIALIRRDFEWEKHPGGSDILLVIEVASASLDYHREVKMPHYAASGIPEAWIFDLSTDCIERHTGPDQNRYGLVTQVKRGLELASTVLPNLVFVASEVLGPPKCTADHSMSIRWSELQVRSAGIWAFPSTPLQSSEAQG